ncbi:MAG: hypothetical protein U0904_04995 [Candidatus Nanopelagicales bacterium]|nr:hypothetical protein [Candidatus Nanopelagicales bacterium]
MAGDEMNEFLDRVFAKVQELSHDKFNYKSWRHDGRPTKEGVGIKPGLEVDVDKMVSRVMDLPGYVDNIKYVVESEFASKVSDLDVVFTQKVTLPLLGSLQFANHMFDAGERDGYRVLAWEQDDALTDALDKKHGGARMAYSWGAWLIRPEEVGYALSSAPRKSDVGGLKFAILTKGADATAGEAIKGNIEGMVSWSLKD